MSKLKEVEREGFLDLDRTQLIYDGGWRVWMRVSEVCPDEGRPDGIDYALVLYNPRDGRVLGYDNTHPVDTATGPARKSKRPKRNDH